MAEIEPVDAAELAELERMAERQDVPYRGEAVPSSQWEQGKQSKAGSMLVRLARPEDPAGSGEKVVAPPGATLSEARLVRLEHMLRHTMNLVIVLAEILRVDPAEVLHVDQQNRAAEAQQGRPPA